jgi:hypothetical protein
MWRYNGIFKIIPMKNGKEISYQTKATPSKINIYAEDATCEICFEDKNTLRFRCTNMDLNLQCLQTKFPYG